MTGFRFDVIGPGKIEPETVELDGVPIIGHRLRVRQNGEARDLYIVVVTWFHAPGALSKSGLLTLSENPP